METIDINNTLNLPLLDDIVIEPLYYCMPLSLFCQKLGISEDDFINLKGVKNVCSRKNC